MINYQEYIGKRIIKISRKPFKSTFQIGVPIKLTINPHTNKEAFLMDDGSIVDCFKCELYTK